MEVLNRNFVQVTVYDPDEKNFLFFDEEEGIRSIVQDRMGNTIGEGFLAQRYAYEGRIQILEFGDILRLRSRGLGFQLGEQNVFVTCGGRGGGNEPSRPASRRGDEEIDKKLYELATNKEKLGEAERAFSRKQITKKQFAEIKHRFLHVMDEIIGEIHERNPGNLAVDQKPIEIHLVEKYPECPNAWNGMVHFSVRKNNYEKALEYLDREIRLRPSLLAYVDKGNICIRLKEYSRAIEAFDRALTFDSEDADAYLGRGIANRKLDNQWSACSDFDNAIRYRRDFAKAYFHRGLSKERQYDKDGALDDFRRATEIKPSNDDYRNAYERALEERSGGAGSSGTQYDWESYDTNPLEKRVEDLEIRVDRVEKEMKALSDRFARATEEIRLQILQDLTLNAQSDDQDTKMKAKQTAMFVLKEHQNVISLSDKLRGAGRILANVVGAAAMLSL